jgi:hypothetical protein
LADRYELAVDGLALSDDGRELLAGEASGFRESSVLSWWRIDVPADPRAWIEHATNARKPSLVDGTIDWRPLTASPVPGR